MSNRDESFSIHKTFFEIGCPKPSAFKSPIKTATYSMLEFLRASLALYFHKMPGVSTCFEHFQPTAGGLEKRCADFTQIFDLRGDGVIRADEFLDFGRRPTWHGTSCFCSDFDAAGVGSWGFWRKFRWFLGSWFFMKSLQIASFSWVFFFSGWVILVQLRSRAGPGFCSS